MTLRLDWGEKQSIRVGSLQRLQLSVWNRVHGSFLTNDAAQNLQNTAGDTQWEQTDGNAYGVLGRLFCVLVCSDGRGYERGTDVLKLLKPLYGTKQASRNWSKSVKGAMLKVGFVQSESDPCLYRLDRQGSFIHAVIHVDDFAVFHDNQKLCDEIFEELTKSVLLREENSLICQE